MEKEIKQKRDIVRQQFISRAADIGDGTITQLSTEDLKLLFDLYDKTFLQGYFACNFKGKLIFSLSTKMTRAAGKTIVPKRIAQLKPEDVTYEIRIGVNFFFRYNALGRDKVVSGIKTHDALEALQIVFEHELCHLIEFYEFQSSSCKQDRFKMIAKNIFGHMDSYHHLPTEREIANEKYGFKGGDTVTFEFEGQAVRGIVNRINKRATVMVPDEAGVYVDRQGRRYKKFYVPLIALKK
ncbi:hypothetical protein [Petroclostridium sp. X23]|uniref:hypothetical protein n=1 Tax=Petroclostridium sp. X23 TaxID=3045146 RepID=UPI0024ADBA3D|nr:hypothetical protein [Petroclostridium sp. X23]WHH60374.1 hypothetical protein QKW49_06505 [Petroclostridium sp. X23]